MAREVAGSGTLRVMKRLKETSLPSRVAGALALFALALGGDLLG
jgi:hypothetical protein